MANPPSLCRIFCLCATWIQIASAISETPVVKDAPLPLIRGIGIIPSGPRSIHILPSAHSDVIQSQPPPTTQAPSSPSSLSFIPSTYITPFTGVSVSAYVPYSGLPPYTNTSTAATLVVSSLSGNASQTPVMFSTDQGLRPIPPAATTVGDPNGHPEVPESGFTGTRSCKGCDPPVEISAIGWQDNSGSSSAAGPAVATITAGSSSIVVSQASEGGNFVIAGSTLTSGQTVTIGDTPIIVQTSAGRPEVVLGSSTLALQPPELPQITDAPVALPPLLTIGTTVITPGPQTQYIVADQTLSPGGPPITVSGTTISLAPSATALVINGKSSSIVPPLGNVYTTEMPAAFSFNNDVYTVNRAGFIIIGPGTTLVPGGSPVTVGGTTLSFDQSGTAVVVQGSSSMLQPVTTVVTLTKSIGVGGVAGGSPTGHGLAKPTTSPISSGGSVIAGSCFGSNDWLGGLVLLLLCWSSGILAFSL